MKDHYKTLGIPRDANPEQIRGAWKTIAKETHPDGLPAGQGLRKPAEALLKEANEAYEVLMDADKKAAHDAELGMGAFSTGFSSDITDSAMRAYGSMVES